MNVANTNNVSLQAVLLTMLMEKIDNLTDLINEMHVTSGDIKQTFVALTDRLCALEDKSEKLSFTADLNVAQKPLFDTSTTTTDAADNILPADTKLRGPINLFDDEPTFPHVSTSFTAGLNVAQKPLFGKSTKTTDAPVNTLPADTKLNGPKSLFGDKPTFPPVSTSFTADLNVAQKPFFGKSTITTDAPANALPADTKLRGPINLFDDDDDEPTFPPASNSFTAGLNVAQKPLFDTSTKTTDAPANASNEPDMDPPECASPSHSSDEYSDAYFDVETEQGDNGAYDVSDLESTELFARECKITLAATPNSPFAGNHDDGVYEDALLVINVIEDDIYEVYVDNGKGEKIFPHFISKQSSFDIDGKTLSFIGRDIYDAMKYVTCEFDVALDAQDTFQNLNECREATRYESYSF